MPTRKLIKKHKSFYKFLLFFSNCLLEGRKFMHVNLTTYGAFFSFSWVRHSCPQHCTEHSGSSCQQRPAHSWGTAAHGGTHTQQLQDTEQDGAFVTPECAQARTNRELQQCTSVLSPSRGKGLFLKRNFPSQKASRISFSKPNLQVMFNTNYVFHPLILCKTGSFFHKVSTSFQSLKAGKVALSEHPSKKHYPINKKTTGLSFY